MRVIEDVRTCDTVYPHVVLTVGSFDGIHLGHQRILRELVECARERHGTAALMTLRPHPRAFFAPESAPAILTDFSQQEELIAAAGVDVLYVLPFNREVASLDRRAFVEEVVVGRCRARDLIVGHDFAFGRNAAGNYAYLAEIAPEYGFQVREVPPLIVDGERVSSTLIRELILEGEVHQVDRFLGRRYALRGKVIAGRGIGRKLGFPTANIEPGNKTVPAHGVYAAEVRLEGEAHMAAVNIGIAPTIRHEDTMVEAHLLDFDAPLVGKTLDVVFHRRLRPEKKYESHEKLMAAIRQDVEDVRSVLAEARTRDRTTTLGG